MAYKPHDAGSHNQPMTPGVQAAIDAADARDPWPKLTKPARVGNGTFQTGVSSRLVVEAAQRQHTYAEEEGRLTDEQARQHERNRRKLWDMVNGPLCSRMSGGEPCNLRPPCPDCGRALPRCARGLVLKRRLDAWLTAAVLLYVANVIGWAVWALMRGLGE